MKTVLTLSLTLALAACTTTAQTPAGMAVKIVDSKPSGCELLDDLDTTGYNMNREESLNYVRNRTAGEGGDTLRISKEVNYSYGGMVLGSNDYIGHKVYMYKCGK